MKSMIAWATEHPLFANVLMIGILLGGFNALFRLPVQMLPAFERNIIRISIDSPNSQPQEVEESICLKVEEALQGIVGVQRVDSVATENGAKIQVYLDTNTESQIVLNEVKTRVEKIQNFPANSRPPEISLLFYRSELMQILLFSEDDNKDSQTIKKELKELTTTIKDELLELPGIREVEWFGLSSPEISIELSRKALQKYDLTFSTVVQILRENNLNLPGGTIQSKSGNIKIYSQTRRYRGDEYGELLIITRDDGTKVHLRDIATIRDGFVESDFQGRFNGKPALRIVIYTSKSQDAITTSDAVKTYLQQKQLQLPEKIKLVFWADLSEFIKNRMYMLTDSAINSFVLVILSLWFFLSLRLSFWIALGIPVSFAGGFLVLWMCGQSLNMISIFALMIAIGIVVDDAIVIGENIETHRKAKGLEAPVYGAHEMCWPVIASTATTIIAFAPMFFVSGTLGKFMREIPIAVIAVLTTSLIESFFILPHHIRSASSHKDFFPKLRVFLDTVIEFIITRIFQPMYFFCLKHTLIVIAFAIISVVLSVGLIQSGVVRFISFPKLDNEVLQAKVTFVSGTHSRVLKKAILQLENAARQVETKDKGNIVRMYSEINSQRSFEEGTVILELAKAKERQYHSNEILNRWRKLVGEIPETLSMTFEARRETLQGKSLTIKILAKDATVLQKAGEECRHLLRQYQGIYNIETDFHLGKIEIYPILNDKGRLLGLTEEDIGQQLHQGFAGEEALLIQRGSDEVPVTVRYPRNERNSIADLENTTIHTASGQKVPISFVAQFGIRQTLSQINREDRKRRLLITTDVDEAMISIDKIRDNLQQELFPFLQKKYPQLRINFAGQQEENKQSLQDVTIGLQYALLAIFMILSLIFSSYVQPFLIMTIIPFSFVGAVFGHWLLGYNISGMSLFGVVALAGVVVNDSLVLIDAINRNIAMGNSVDHSLKIAGVSRFRAISLTTLTTFIGLTPIVFTQNIHAQFLAPMAISLGIGLVFGSFLVLFLIPVLFLYLNKIRCIVYWFQKSIWPSPEQVEPAFQNRFVGHSDV